MKKFLLVAAFVIGQSAFSQQPDFLKIKKYRIGYLDDKIQETSGLNMLNGKLYTFNDSGNAPELFEISKTSGEIVKTFKVNGKNTDWEALTNDGTHFYIGDFGNNDGSRRHLKIFKVPFKNDSLQNDQVKEILFHYPEQTDYISTYFNTDFDAEAMVYTNGKIHLFTKEWASKATHHYVIDPEKYEKQNAAMTETYKTNFMVTDAAYFEKKLYLVGYTKKTEVFLDIFTETEPGVFFNERPKHYYLGSSLSIGQIEGIAVDETGIFISGEKFKSRLGSTKPAFYFIPKDKLKD
ncbi:hypothetical protein C1637_06390 [Chryseobacterium lactis]|uniref:T9SS C-terminal target domain-containing protein n=1 Tax=Chryseobacterium lactis TaxID=1241981 RepID=A0A3G6RLT6_CHRLC|nr:hypothetical protein [Chryseobacterium lactis]AZA84465.1 hypothetical protein EG342_22360 [Chryseobacterium lactis]AZB04853.1 hypothetical protein EG341_13240 [Chryseobacterium lactis]PNW14584.1 hypothetical protein C1637_06390 [Chryseobacterium lactis]